MRVLHVGHGYTPYHHGGLLAYAEDLMEAQLERGYEVSYFCVGRHYPLLRPHVRRRRRGGLDMHELVNSPVVIGPLERGTRHPRRDVGEPTVERLFGEVMDEVRPDLVHVQELGGLPSTVLTLPRERGVPVLITLQDYFPLCPTVKLYDADGRVCLREEPAPQCARCCRDAPGDLDPVIGTLGYHRRRLEARLPLLERLPKPRQLARKWRGSDTLDDRAPEPTPESAPAGDVAGFQLRREANVARLNQVDRLVAMSARVAEIYSRLGVDPARLQTMQFTLRHLERLRPRRPESVGRPVRFVTLAGCSTRAKGAHVVAGALDELAARGLTPEDLTLSVAGQVDPALADRIGGSPFVRLVGDYEHEALDAMLDGYDVGVVPSVWEEAYGYTGIEMVAKGLPVIGNAIGGIVEYVREGETGWLNRDRSAAGLAAIMATIARDPDQALALNRRILERHAELVKPLAAHVAELHAVYGELIAQSSSTSVPAG